MPSGPDLADVSVDFPRPQRGGGSQHALVTMLAEFWRDTEEHLPTATVLRLAQDCGIPRAATSPGLSRLKQRGVLETRGAGRATAYRFTAAARARLAVGAGQVAAFGADDAAWDGFWTVVAFTLPESERTRREALRSRLRWLGFAPLYGALWVAAGDRGAETGRLCEDFGVEDFFCAALADATIAGRSPLTAWDLTSPPAGLQEFIEDFDSAAGTAPDHSPAAAFALRVHVIDRWRALPWDAPPFPAELLPPDWPLSRAREIYLRVRRETREATERHVREALEATSPALAAAVVVHDTPA